MRLTLPVALPVLLPLGEADMLRVPLPVRDTVPVIVADKHRDEVPLFVTVGVADRQRVAVILSDCVGEPDRLAVGDLAPDMLRVTENDSDPVPLFVASDAEGEPLGLQLPEGLPDEVKSDSVGEMEVQPEPEGLLEK